MKDQYRVMGNPIAHSKSPWIHAKFAEQTGQILSYEKQFVPISSFAEYLSSFRHQEGRGVNITKPFKILALEYVLQNAGEQSCSERAKLAGAINTIKFNSDGSCFGDNTDGVGLVRDLINNLNWPIKDQSILLLGAGGAIRGVIASLLAEQPKQVIIVNRAFNKAQVLSEIFSHLGEISAVDFNAIAGMQFNLIINGTTTSLQNEAVALLPDVLIHDNIHCYDMCYDKEPTSFLQWAHAQQCKHLANGLGMLVEQAAEAFYIWRGVKPETHRVLTELKKIMNI